jgi:hypothetical protein
MASSPDPVAEAAKYQRFLLEKLGDDDPAVVQAETPAALRRLFDEAGERVRERPSPSEWSVLEAAGHLLDAELVCAARYRWILSHDEPALMGYDQDLWVERLAHNEDDPDDLLAFFEALRTANPDLWSGSSAKQRARVGLHEERGPESFELLFRLMGGHDRNRLAQVRNALAGS